MQEGLGVIREADEVIAGVRVGKQGGNMFTRSRAGRVPTKVDKRLARELYQGGDDVWKIYNYEFERNKLISAFGGDVKKAEEAIGRPLDQYAADIVKNTVPNYERVPQFIKGIRKAACR